MILDIFKVHIIDMNQFNLILKLKIPNETSE